MRQQFCHTVSAHRDSIDYSELGLCHILARTDSGCLGSVNTFVQDKTFQVRKNQFWRWGRLFWSNSFLRMLREKLMQCKIWNYFCQLWCTKRSSYEMENQKMLSSWNQVLTMISEWSEVPKSGNFMRYNFFYVEFSRTGSRLFIYHLLYGHMQSLAQFPMNQHFHSSMSILVIFLV